MSSEEQIQILKMVEEGKISAEEALKLIQALETPAVEGEVIAAPASTYASQSGAEEPDTQEFEEIASKARGLWQIPLWVGVFAVVLSAYWLYSLVVASNYGFWFYCALLPLLLGVGIAGPVHQQPDITLVICECGTDRQRVAAQYHAWASAASWARGLVSEKFWAKH